MPSRKRYVPRPAWACPSRPSLRSVGRVAPRPRRPAGRGGARGLVRSARFAAEIGSPVLTIHLFAPLSPEEFRAAAPLDAGDGGGVPALLRRRLRVARGHAADRKRPADPAHAQGRRVPLAGGGHWRDLLEWRVRVPELGFTFDTSHAALFRSFAAAYPSLFGLASDERSRARRYVEELGPDTESRTSPMRRHPRRGPADRTGRARTRPAIVRRLGEQVPVIVAEINEPDPAHSRDMKSGTARSNARWPSPPTRHAGPCAASRPRTSTGSRSSSGAIPLPSVLELQERFGGRRILITGGGGSIGARARDLPRRVPAGAHHAAGRPRRSLIADRRQRSAESLERMSTRPLRRPRGPRLETSCAAPTPDMVFHLAAFKHVDWAEHYPRGIRRRRTCTAAGTCCAPPSTPASRPSSSRPRTRRRWPPASTAGRSASWSSCVPDAARRRRARSAAVRL